MSFDKSKGLLAIRNSDGWKKLDPYIQVNGYTATPDQMQDLDSYVNSNGRLIRNVLKISRSKFEFSTPYMQYATKKKFATIIKNGTTYNSSCSAAERKVYVRFFDDYTDSYKFCYCYIPDIQWKYGGTYHGNPMYMPTSVSLIAYADAKDTE